jgi:hypothetical protein
MHKFSSLNLFYNVREVDCRGCVSLMCLCPSRKLFPLMRQGGGMRYGCTVLAAFPISLVVNMF